MKLSVYLIEDQKSTLDDQIALVQEFCPLWDILGASTDPSLAIKEILYRRPEVLIVDIEMPGVSGLQLVRHLHRQSFDPMVVFLTAAGGYALEAFRVSAVDYLMKPLTGTQLIDLDKKLQKALLLERLEQSKNKGDSIRYMVQLLYHPDQRARINVVFKESIHTLFASEIIYAEASGAYTYVMMTDGQKMCLSKNLAWLEDQLPHSIFARASRSVLVNLGHIRAIERGLGKADVILSNDSAVPLSFRKTKAFIEAFHHYQDE
jgi:two-component system LytT family response regulator